jgi:hypothetical protein
MAIEVWVATKTANVSAPLFWNPLGDLSEHFVPNPRPELLLRRITPANVSFNDHVSSPPHYSGLRMRTVKRSAPVVDDLCRRGENDVLLLLRTLSKRKLRRIQCFKETLVFSTSLIDSAPASTYLQLYRYSTTCRSSYARLLETTTHGE